MRRTAAREETRVTTCAILSACPFVRSVVLDRVVPATVHRCRTVATRGRIGRGHPASSQPGPGNSPRRRPPAPAARRESRRPARWEPPVFAAAGLVAAARSLGVPHRTAWQRIREMEDRLHVRLVDTTSGGPGGGRSRLSPAGQAFVRRYHVMRAGRDELVLERYEGYAQPSETLNRSFHRRGTRPLGYTCPSSIATMWHRARIGSIRALALTLPGLATATAHRHSVDVSSCPDRPGPPTRGGIGDAGAAGLPMTRGRRVAVIYRSGVEAPRLLAPVRLVRARSW
jgi:molybdate transport repressor ModE-like protein